MFGSAHTHFPNCSPKFRNAPTVRIATSPASPDLALRRKRCDAFPKVGLGSAVLACRAKGPVAVGSQGTVPRGCLTPSSRITMVYRGAPLRATSAVADLRRRRPDSSGAAAPGKSADGGSQRVGRGDLDQGPPGQGHGARGGLGPAAGIPVKAVAPEGHGSAAWLRTRDQDVRPEAYPVMQVAADRALRTVKTCIRGLRSGRDARRTRKKQLVAADRSLLWYHTSHCQSEQYASKKHDRYSTLR